MHSLVYACSRPHESILPRPHRDAHQRYLTYGPIVPMDQPGWLYRIFGWR